ncbi:MAG: RdgB/HAM1 family non-canonical purine NTP pyrophosphatase [Rikenellaceae bacterium]|nr:RdgB/HAM1 family non-canonical purine NTP pyrophosphatase [Rikenellaceae bacterium]
MELIFATNNRHKLEEAAQILGGGYILKTPSDFGLSEEIPEERDTLEGNAVQKAEFVKFHTGLDCFADDTGLEVEALGGEPGVRSARYATDGHDFGANTALLLKNLEGVADRRARFRTVIALILDGRLYTFEGEVRGKISRTAAGNKGFGYDPVFIPEGYTETFAQLPAEVKNAISHRAEAVRKLAVFLKDYGKYQGDPSLKGK